MDGDCMSGNLKTAYDEDGSTTTTTISNNNNNNNNNNKDTALQ